LVSVVSLAIPIIQSALEPDDSSITLTYIDRADISIPLIASNKGSRPGVMDSIAGLKIITGTKGDVATQTHLLLTIAVNGSRLDLFIPENTSKQFFFFVNPEQYAPDVFEKLANDLQSINSVRQCTLTVGYLDFSGKKRRVDLVIFDADAIRSVPSREKTDSEVVGRILGALECIGKIPYHVRQQYKLPLG